MGLRKFLSPFLLSREEKPTTALVRTTSAPAFSDFATLDRGEKLNRGRSILSPFSTLSRTFSSRTSRRRSKLDQDFSGEELNWIHAFSSSITLATDASWTGVERSDFDSGSNSAGSSSDDSGVYLTRATEALVREWNDWTPPPLSPLPLPLSSSPSSSASSSPRPSTPTPSMSLPLSPPMPLSPLGAGEKVVLDLEGRRVLRSRRRENKRASLPLQAVVGARRAKGSFGVGSEGEEESDGDLGQLPTPPSSLSHLPRPSHRHSLPLPHLPHPHSHAHQTAYQFPVSHPYPPPHPQILVSHTPPPNRLLLADRRPALLGSGFRRPSIPPRIPISSPLPTLTMESTPADLVNAASHPSYLNVTPLPLEASGLGGNPVRRSSTAPGSGPGEISWTTQMGARRNTWNGMAVPGSQARLGVRNGGADWIIADRKLPALRVANPDL